VFVCVCVCVIVIYIYVYIYIYKCNSGTLDESLSNVRIEMKDDSSTEFSGECSTSNGNIVRRFFNLTVLGM
jgi:hypothetical protein